MATAQKNQNNKINAEKAKGMLAMAKDVIKGSLEIAKLFKKWFTGEASFKHKEWHRKFSDGRMTEEGGSCTEGDIKVGPGEGNRESVCAEVHGATELVKKPNGTIENQLKLQYVFKPACYFRV
jgi:hypothetical protein